MDITLKNKKIIRVDQDFEIPEGWNLIVCHNGFAALSRPTKDKLPSGYTKYERIYLHRYVMGAKRGEHVDHISGDTLDNRRENLRICTNQQNSWNKHNRRERRDKHLTRGYIGVHARFLRRKQKYVFDARGSVNSKRIMIKSGFETPEEAARAYDKYMKEIRGEFGVYNEI